MKAILKFDNGDKVITDVLKPLPRKEWETQREYEKRFIDKFNTNQPFAVHKVVAVHITRN